MKRLILIVMMAAFTLAPYAQQRRSGQKGKARTTQTQGRCSEQTEKSGADKQRDRDAEAQYRRDNRRDNIYRRKHGPAALTTENA